MATAARPHDPRLLLQQGVRLLISEQAVHDLLTSQPRATMLASYIPAVFAPRDDAERHELTRVIDKVCVVAPDQKGTPVLRLKGNSLKPRARGTPLPIEPMAVRALLLAQPGEQMAARVLSERFAPADDAERMRLSEVIHSVADLVTSEHPGAEPMVRLRPTTTPPRASCVMPEDATPLPSAIGDDDSQPVTAVERDLVRKVLGNAPGGALRAEELARMIAPGDGGAKRRLARVVAEVARVAQRSDGSGGTVPVLVLRDATNGPLAACDACPQPR